MASLSHVHGQDSLDNTSGGPLQQVVSALTNGTEEVQVAAVQTSLSWFRRKIVIPFQSTWFYKSRAFHITMTVLGILLVTAGLVFTLVLYQFMDSRAFFGLIPTLIGMAEIIRGSLFTDSSFTVQKCRIVKKTVNVIADLADDGVINNSAKIFEDKSGDQSSDSNQMKVDIERKSSDHNKDVNRTS